MNTATLQTYKQHSLKFIPLDNKYVPIFKDYYSKYKERENSEEEIEVWSDSFKNFGILITPNILAIDIDEPRIFRWIFGARPDDVARETWVSVTKSGGYHVYYNRESKEKVTVKPREGFIEIYTSDRYFIEEPSANYKWLTDINNLKIKKLTEKEEKEIIEKAEFIKKYARLIKILKKLWSKGQRDFIVFHVSGFLRKRGVSEEDCVEIIKMMCDLCEDEEKDSRIRVVKRTYEEISEDDVNGIAGLKEYLEDLTEEDRKYIENFGKEEKKRSGGGKAKKRRRLLKFIDYLKENYKFFKHEGEKYVWTGREAIKIPVTEYTKQFKAWLVEEWFKCFPDSYAAQLRDNSADPIDVLDVITGKFATEESNIYEVAAVIGDEIYYDLNNGNELVISKDEIKIQPYTHYWTRSKTAKEVSIDLSAEPEDIELLLKYFNVDKRDKLLLISYIASTLIPNIQHPILILTGPPGSGKTTLFKILAELICPSSIPTLALPQKDEDLTVLLKNSYLALFDNVPYSIDNDRSDFIARAVTGEGIKKRRLYTDADVYEYNYRKIIGINGINLSLTRSDLIDRAIVIELKRIQKFKSERDLFKDLEKDLPKVRGALFKLIQYAYYHSNEGREFSTFYRLSDWVSFCIKFADAINVTRDEFEKILDEKIKFAKTSAITDNVIAQLIDELKDEFKFITSDIKIEKENYDCDWIGSATKLLEILKKEAEDKKIKLNINNPRALSAKLREISEDLKELMGICIEFKKINRKRAICIKVLNKKTDEKERLENKKVKTQNNTTNKDKKTQESTAKDDTKKTKEAEKNKKESLEEILKKVKVEMPKSRIEQEREESENSIYTIPFIDRGRSLIKKSEYLNHLVLDRKDLELDYKKAREIMKQGIAKGILKEEGDSYLFWFNEKEALKKRRG